ncbi:hypothetical protein J6600_07040 [Bacillus sp. LJBV19]|nr:hypothetical protein J6600_07040 [Bacillus sp. LJBV19]
MDAEEANTYGIVGNVL